MTTEPDAGLAVAVGGEDPELSGRLSAELTTFNNAATGADDEADLSVRATDGAGELVGGLTGWTWGGCGGINMLWVREDHRRRGVGGRLLRAAEEEARRRGCDRMIVSSFEFQAPPFYRRHGYVQVGRSEGFPGGYADLHFIKRLDGSEPRSRIRLVAVLDVPEEHLAAFARYEERVLALLAGHGGRLEQRLRTGDGRTEVHLLSFTGRDGYDSYLADPRRAAYRAEELPGVELAARVLEVSEVQPPPAAG
ncbi:N-acetyltransferase [Plantactinospora sp. BB1]|uniref:GNAT family N-acetyltransferase n=1 Tax=Plantactinospora sp. BB1 TaxID=2071627 RepID=UPI000D1540F2|nr:GNAT family N-acetyltransferase [Plantactinospora sp. BB1]AVT40715.1 N-acetyltransferase [Plantactinospora sp. BB1]